MPDEIFDFLEDEEDIEEEEDNEIDETEEEEDEENEIDDDDDLPYEYGIDFDTGQLTGEIVNGLEAVKVWAWLALKTTRYKYLIYSWDYGSELESLIGTNYSEEFTKARAHKFVTECLDENPYITSINDFEATFEKDKLELSFMMMTEFGEEGITLDV